MICFTGIFLHYHYWIHTVTPLRVQHKYAFLKCIQKDTRHGYAHKGFRFFEYEDSVGILTNFFCGYGMGMGVEIQSPLESDGYYTPSYSWTDADGDIVSTSNSTTLSKGRFNLSYSATGNFTSFCGATYRVIGYAVGKKWPKNSTKL